jgi:ADP-heptose:LPS heptosyltransferase
MFNHLQIYDPRDRWIVGSVDAVLAAVALAGRLVGSRPATTDPQRILLLRLERVGDLIMTVDAIDAVRRLAPGAEIHLVVGSWNEDLARLIPGVDRLETLDAPWLARESGGQSFVSLLARARRWRGMRFDLTINFEGDLRTNLLAGLSGAPRRVGFDMAGGGACLTDRVPHDRRIHTSDNALRLVERAFDRATPPGTPRSGGRRPRLALPPSARERAGALIGRSVPRVGSGDANGPLVGVHAGGGRRVKQWDPERFAAVAARLAASHGATIVLTGSGQDRTVVDELRAVLDPGVTTIDVVDQIGLVPLAAILERLDLFITGDTGPMHLAAALGVPVVAIFGPSDPARYAPRDDRTRVVRVELPCSPCNRIRRPPARCVGRVPDCLLGVSADAVCDAAVELLTRHLGERARRSTFSE